MTILALARFDGPTPYNTDFTGEPNAHPGVVASYAGGVIYRPGKFGKGLQCGRATTNMLLNPIAGTTGNFGALGAATVTRSTDYALYGTYCYKVVTTAAANDGMTLTLSALTNAIHYVPIYTYGNAWTTIQFSLDGTNYSNATALGSSDGTWYRYGAQIPAVQANGSTTLYIRQSDATARTIYIGAAQVEAFSFATPQCAGSLGTGHSWSGAAHASTSARTLAIGLYSSTSLNLATGSVGMWFHSEGLGKDGRRPWQANLADGYIAVLYHSGANSNKLWVASKGAGAAPSIGSSLSPALSAGWHHFVLTWQAGAEILYVDGVATGAAINYAAPAGAGSIFFCYADNTVVLDDLIDDYFCIDTVLTPSQALAIYTSGARVLIMEHEQHQIAKVLPIGSAGQVERTNSSANAPEWGTLTGADMALGTPGVRGIWPLSNPAETGYAQDQSGQERHLTYAGNPVYGVHASGGGYIDLDGTGDYLTRADEAGLDITGTESIMAAAIRGLTISCVAMLDSPSAATPQEIFGKFNSVGNQKSYLLRYSTSSSGKLEIVISADGSTNFTLQGPAPSAGAYYHLLAVFVPSTSLSLFVNGTKYTTITSVPASIYSGTSPLAVGIHGDRSSNIMAGNVGRCWVAASAISDAQAVEHFAWVRRMYGI